MTAPTPRTHSSDQPAQTLPSGGAEVADLGLRHTPPLPGQVLGWPAPAPQPPATQGTLALDLTAFVPMAAGDALPALPASSADPDDPVADPVADGTAAADVGDVVKDGDSDGLQMRARRFLQAVVEMVGADRPVIQLLRWATPEVYAEVCHRAGTVATGTDSGHRSRTGRPRVVSVHVSRPTPGVAEVAAHVRHAGRSRALAARLEQRRDRWVCTALQLG